MPPMRCGKEVPFKFISLANSDLESDAGMANNVLGTG